ncbi:MAG: LLM class F420-dependent oxidoreductase [Ktedonobacteraceae bacterium]
MARVEFGFMLRQKNDPGRSWQNLLVHNQTSISALTSGFSTLWVEDHLQWEMTDTFECLTTLSYLAASYPQFKVGTLVLSQSYRNPALLAKMMATLQALSNGRVILGLGAGWKEDEYLSYNYPFPTTKTRMEQLEEAAQLVRAMWTAPQPVTFEGKHYAVRNAFCIPQPSPTIPLLIGGGGEHRTLALVARYADWWNFNSCTVEEYEHKLSILKQHCKNVGRDFSEIKLTYLSTMSVAEDPAKVQRNPSKHFIAGNAEEVTQELQRFRDIGVSHFIFRFLDHETIEHFVAHVVPNFV